MEAPPEGEIQITFVREGPKVGRNDPCPCGSGKNTKNAAETTTELKTGETVEKRKAGIVPRNHKTLPFTPKKVDSSYIGSIFKR